MVEIYALPPNAHEVQGDELVLAEGEITGHAHVIRLGCETRGYRQGNDLFIQSGRSTTLRHEEHAPLELPSGNYRVIRQRVYHYGAILHCD